MKFIVAGNTVVRIDASAGGTLVAISSFVDAISSAPGKSISPIDVTTFVDTAERFMAGIELSQEFQLEGPFDDQSPSGIDAIMATAVGTILSFEFSPMGTGATARKVTMETLVTSYVVSAPVKERISYTVSLKQDGAATIGTT